MNPNDEQIDALLEQLRARRLRRRPSRSTPFEAAAEVQADRLVLRGGTVLGLSAAALVIYFLYRTSRSAAQLEASAKSIRARREEEAGL